MTRRTCDYNVGCNVPEHWQVRGDEREQQFMHVAPTPPDHEIRGHDG